MGKLNMTEQEMRDYIDLSAAIIEPCIEDIYITKRLLMQDGMKADEVDDCIGEKILEHDGYFQSISDEAYDECVCMEKEKLAEAMAGRSEAKQECEEELKVLDPENMPSQAELIRNNLKLIGEKVKQVMFVKRGMEKMGVDPGDVAFAIMDYAKECDERYMNMLEDEFDQMVFNRILEELLGDEEFDENAA